MEKKNNVFGSVLSIVLIAVIGAGLLFGVNAFTAPIIESNSAGAAAEALKVAIPEGKDFELLYNTAGEGTGLENVPATVQSVYAETAGLGYVVTLSTTEGYTKEPMDITVAMNGEGTIIYSAVDVYPDSKDFGAEYPASYLGQDSAMADVSLVAGVTFSSSAYKNAVNDAFTVLIDNGKFAAGVKSDDQILKELVATVCPGMANASGNPQYEEFEAAGTYVAGGMKALNEGLCAFIVNDSETVLAICNASGSVCAYNTAGEDVSDKLSADAKAEVVSMAAGNIADVADADMKAIAKLVPESAQLEPIALEGVFSTVTGAYKVTDGESVSYAFSARPYGYSNIPMAYWFVLDENGAVTAMTAKDLIIEPEYFTSYKLDKDAYKAAFAGVTADSYTDELALVTGATFTTQATDSAAKDVFAAFETLKANGGI